MPLPVMGLISDAGYEKVNEALARMIPKAHEMGVKEGFDPFITLESFNVFAHLIQKNMKFIIRMKDINSNGILSAYDLPDSQFDTHIKTTLTRRRSGSLQRSFWKMEAFRC